MRLSVFTATMLGVAFTATTAKADTWCSQQAAGKIFCEDFDRYCNAPPPYPQPCTDWSIAALRRTWPKPESGTELWEEGTHVASPP